MPKKEIDKLRDKLSEKEKELKSEEAAYRNLRSTPRKSSGEWNALDKMQDVRKELEGEIRELKKQISELEK